MVAARRKTSNAPRVLALVNSTWTNKSSVLRRAMTLLDQGQADPAVLAALVLDLADRSAPISPVERTCVPPQAWRSTPSISTRRTRPAAGRRAHRHRAHQLRPRVELRGVDPREADRAVLGDPARDAQRDLVLVDRRALEVEVEPAPVRADLAAGDRARDRGAQEVHRAVHAHQAVAARPVDLGDQAGADRGRAAAVCEPMGDLSLDLNRVDDRERGAVGEQQPAAIARLAAAWQ